MGEVRYLGLDLVLGDVVEGNEVGRSADEAGVGQREPTEPAPTTEILEARRVTSEVLMTLILGCPRT